MSLEDAIKENTAVLKSLVELLKVHNLGLATGAPVPLTEAPKAEKPKAEKPEDEPTEVKLSYEDDVRTPFLALLNSKRDVALKLLADLGVANLKGFEGKPETYADLAGKIKEAANG
jgi:hypothetical protein